MADIVPIEGNLPAVQDEFDIDLEWLIKQIVTYCEAQAGVQLYPYQREFAERIVESIILNDGDEITALFARQCIAEGSVIHTRDGKLVRIEEHPDSWKTQENAPILEIHIRGGYIIRCTKNHPIMTDKGWIPAGLLREKDKVVTLSEWNRFGNGMVPYSFSKYVNMHSNEVLSGEFEMNEELAELVGWLTADGSVNSKGQSAKFTNINPDYLNRVEYIVAKYFPDIKIKKYSKGKGFDYLFTTGENSRFNSLKDFIRIMNYDHGFPTATNYFTRKQVCAFFRGMFAAGGYIYTRKDGLNIEIGLACGNDKVYAEYCRELLNKLGVAGQIKPEIMAKGTGTFYRIVIGGQKNARIFSETVGTVLGKPVPYLPYSRENKTETFKDIDGEVFEYNRVVSIKDAGTADVWDVTYPDKGWFICGGVKVHNSGKTETVAMVIAGCMVIIPKLAQMPQFAKLLGAFKKGLWVGLFAPSKEQAFTTFGRARDRIRSDEAVEILNDPEIDTTIDKVANPMILSNGSLLRMQSAAKQAQIESKTYHIIIVEEAQDVDKTKVRKCFAKGTRVLQPDGRYVPIEDVVQNRLPVVGFNEDWSKLETKIPSEWWDNGEQPCYTLRLNNGTKITVTAKHRFYGFAKGWKKQRLVTAEEIISRINSDNPIRVSVPEELPLFGIEEEKDYEKGLILGYLLGDGCLRGGVQFIGEQITTDRLSRLISSVFPDVTGKLRTATTAGLSIAYFGHKNTLVDWLKSLDIMDHKGENKYLPDKVFSRTFYQGLIEGLIETDGSIEQADTKPIISFANISETMVRQVRDILYKFGIHSTIFSRENTGIENGGFGKAPKTLHFIHIKSVKDIRRFRAEFKLYAKENKLNKAICAIRNKQDRNTSYKYPGTIRFYQVTDAEYAGVLPTYCVTVKDHNLIVENMITSQSIHPMGAATNATIIKIGTPNNKRCEFLETIQRNRRLDTKKKRGRRNHFQYDYTVVQKYNPRYKKFIEKEKERLGEESDEFRMSYALQWILERGMFMTDEMMEKILDNHLEHELVSKAYCVAGLDVGKRKDSTVLTIGEVDHTKGEIDPLTGDLKPHVRVLNWLELYGDSYEGQYYEILDFLKNYNVKVLFIDATGVGTPIADRFMAGLDGVMEVVPYDFNLPSKSLMYKTLQSTITSGRLKVPAHSRTRKLRTFRNWYQQMMDLEKDYKNQHMVCAAPKDDDNAHDDYPDSLALMVMAAHHDALPEVIVEDNPIFVVGRRR